MLPPQPEILIVHTGGGLGDVLLATAVVHGLHQRFAGAQIDFLCQSRTAPALQGHTGIRHLWTWPGKGPGGLKAWWDWVVRLRARRYQASLVLWSTTATAWLTWMAGIPHRVGQDSRLSYSFLYNHPVRVRSEHGDTASHWSDILLDYARALPGGTPLTEIRPRVSLQVSEEAHQNARVLLAPLADEAGPLLGLHPFKGPPVELSRWPLEVFADWLRQLEAELGARLVITGSPGETPWAEQILALSGTRALCLAGQTDLATLAALATQCDAFICPDSGPMHVAAAAGARVVGIYAMEEDFPQRWAPLTERCQILRPQPVGCPPGCRKPTCRDYRCYRQVSPQDLVRAVRRLLHEGESPGDGASRRGAP